MNNLWKRGLALLLALVMVIGISPIPVYAEELATSDPSTVITEAVETENEEIVEDEAIVEDEVIVEDEAGSEEETVNEAQATLDAMIAALPAPEEVAALDEAGQEAFRNEDLAPIYAFAAENGINIDGNMTLNAINEAMNSSMPVADHTHEGGVEFQEWTTTDSLPTSGNYCLAVDVTLTGAWRFSGSGTLNLCLNDHVINVNGKWIDASATCTVVVNLYDCGTTVRYYTPNDSGMWVLNTDSTETEYSTTGGIITGGSGAEGGGICVNRGATWNIDENSKASQLWNSASTVPKV